MCDVPAHLRDHSYWRTEPSRIRNSTSTGRAAESRKRRREQDSTSRHLEGPPQKRRRESAAVLSERSPSPQPSTSAQQPSTSAPQARPEAVQLQSQEVQPRAIQEPVWPGPYGPQPGGLPPSAFDAAVEMIMAWMMDSPYNPEM